MKVYTLLLCTATLAVGACSSSGSGSRYTARPDVQEQNYTQKHHAQDRDDKQAYDNYEKREQCQHYRRMPRNYDSACVDRETPEDQTYALLFDFDKSSLRPGVKDKLDKIASSIDQSKAAKVTVTGFTDSSGTSSYNQELSRERAEAVARALRERGLDRRMITTQASGEYDQAVSTQDGVNNQQNRRVIVDVMHRANQET